MPVTFTTDLPAVENLSLDASVEDELTATWDDTINYGSYRVGYRVTGSGTPYTEVAVSEATTSYTITGLVDGEQYDVRVRTETEHATTAYVERMPVTLLPAPGQPTIDAAGTTSVDLSWSDNSDNEDGFDVVRERQYDDGFGPAQAVASVGPGTTSATDATAQPGRTYRYSIRAKTEHVTADSPGTTTTTDSVTATPQGVPADGWRVEIDHPDGRTLRPRLAGPPQPRPTINGLPTIRIPVARDERWLDDAWEDAPLRVWQDGRRLPIDQLEDVETGPGDMALVGVGGTALRTRVTPEFDTKEAHIAMGEQIQAAGLTTNVDDPAADTQSDTLVQSADTESELQGALLDPVEATTPLALQNGGFDPLQTCWFVEGEAGTRSGAIGEPGDTSAYSAGDAVRIQDAGDTVEWTFSPEYRIPEADFGVQVRAEAPSGDTNGWRLEVELEDGTTDVLTSVGAGAGSIFLDWFDETSFGGSGWGSGDIPPGDHTLRLVCEDGGGPSEYFAVDVVAPYDSRYSYTFDNSVDANGCLAGPELKPDAVDVVFEDYASAFNVVGAQADLTIDDAGGQQAIALSNDQGGSYETASNTASFDTTFPSAGASVRLKVTLSRYGSRSNQSPTQGFEGQTLDSYELRADLEDTPVLVNRSFRGEAIDVLQEIADYGDFVFEVRWDDATGGFVVEVTQPGQRSRSADPGLFDYDVAKRTGNVYQEAVIRGARQNVVGEAFNANHGTAVSLAQDGLIEVREVVRDPDTGQTFDRGSDYEMSFSAGEITTLSAGAMVDGDTYEIDYEYKTEGSYAAESAGSDTRTLDRTIPEITDNRGCEQAALYLVQRLQDPLYEVQATIPYSRFEAGQSLVDALSLADLPVDEPLDISNIEAGAAALTLTTRSRQEVGEIVSDLSGRVGAVADRI